MAITLWRGRSNVVPRFRVDDNNRVWRLEGSFLTETRPDDRTCSSVIHYEPEVIPVAWGSRRTSSPSCSGPGGRKPDDPGPEPEQCVVDAPARFRPLLAVGVFALRASAGIRPIARESAPGRKASPPLVPCIWQRLARAVAADAPTAPIPP